MSKALDELQNTVEEACSLNVIRLQQEIKRLREENERLRNEKVAGGPTGLEHEAQVGSVSSPAPATDPEVVCDTPVCIWVSRIAEDRSGRHSHSWVICDGTHVQYCADNMPCFVCGRPIKFAGVATAPQEVANRPKESLEDAYRVPFSADDGA